MEIKVKTQGFDKLMKKFADLEKGAKELHGQHEVPFEELFPDDFMRKSTDFTSIAEMLDASGFDVKTTADFEKIPDAEWYAFVLKRTRFADWSEMQMAAVKQYSLKKLRL